MSGTAMAKGNLMNSELLSNSINDNENDDNDRHFYIKVLYRIWNVVNQICVAYLECLQLNNLDLSPLMINWNVVIKIK